MGQFMAGRRLAKSIFLYLTKISIVEECKLLSFFVLVMNSFSKPDAKYDWPFL